ncbi:hypothetical protein N7447_001468 [Penicillium robsamsonii]|uniref:uncharacterized protein n=1 Tax=Penicillium robsamsonii TaxID=1792511 RepID=UPI0025486CAB|nr:uncharacterized protein N7447_001468 [Penicillium robsamsonii]KAJ5835442.1 hypothetical protein N7447_001468 [Penicillium robsamsonii]
MNLGCLGTGKHPETVIQKGKKYRLRLLAAQTDSWMKLSIDGHDLTVIAADLVPIVPDQTTSVILASANQDFGDYWIRAIYQTAWNGISIERNDIKGIIRDDGASQSDLTAKQCSSITNSCGDEPYASLVPYIKKASVKWTDRTT